MHWAAAGRRSVLSSGFIAREYDRLGLPAIDPYAREPGVGDLRCPTTRIGGGFRRKMLRREHTVAPDQVRHLDSCRNDGIVTLVYSVMSRGRYVTLF